MHNLRIIALSLVSLISYRCFGMDTVQEYRVFDGQQYHAVKSHDVLDPMLRKIKVGQLRKFIEDGGKIRPAKLDNGDYVLRTSVPGKGGGPILAGIFYDFWLQHKSN